MSADGLPAPLHSLLHPVAYPHPAENVRLVTTHLSWVLLTGEVAYKIKDLFPLSVEGMNASEH